MNNSRVIETTGGMPRIVGGMALLDVLLAIVIFVVGMLALASLQGNLTRSSTDGNARTIATNVAEELIEDFRTFERLRTEVGFTAYQDIVDQTLTFERGGQSFTVNVAVDEYFFMPDKRTVTADTDDLPADRDTTISDFKYVELAVNWAGSEFQVGDGNVTSDRLGSGSVTISGIIPSIPLLGAAKIAAEDDGEPSKPPVAYVPGQRPDIVRINLLDSKFKESTSPMPDVIRQNELVETWFDVVTYNNDSSIYIRREEFLVVTCECTLKKATSGALTGLLPTVWNGTSYTTGNKGEFVSKTYGVSANNQQSQYCDTCCRDHHDPDTNSPKPDELYDPDRSASPNEPKWSETGGLDGDHKHYKRANKGGLEEAQVNDDYVEACRMVRKDGYMRVAQDFRQEGFYAFPAGYLDTLNGADAYSNYITSAVTEFYGSNHDMASPPGDLGFDFPGDQMTTDGSNSLEDLTDTSTLPLFGGDQQQMRSRALYIDRQSAELDALLTCVDPDYSDPEKWKSCGATGYTNILQVLPFFEIQTTWLSLWLSDPQGMPVSVTSEAINDNNTHSRGLAVLEDPATAQAITIDVETDMHRGNIGLTATDPITLADTAVDANSGDPLARSEAMLFIDINGGDDGIDPPSNAYTWSGTFTSGVNKVDALSASITPLGSEYCATHGVNEITCSTPLSESGSIRITGYAKQVGQTWIPLWICLTNPPLGMTVVNDPQGLNNAATVSWGVLPDGTSGVAMSIEDSACP